MSAAMTNAATCRHAGNGLVRSLASNARISMDGQQASGAAQVAEGLCGMLEAEQMFAVRLLSPVLGRCELGGAAPVCRVSFVLSDGQGGTRNPGAGMGVTQESGQWKFFGNVHPVAIHASATVQRDRRVDGNAPVDRYARALAFDIAAAPNLACARVSQRDANQQAVTVAYFKRHPSRDVRRLSLWTTDGQGNTPSLDPPAGALRSADDTWVPLPEGDAGDTVVRNFFRGGRSVSVQLFSNADCSTPLNFDGQSIYEVDVEGVPPVWAAMAQLPWPDLTETGRQALIGLTLAAQSNGSLAAAWTIPRGPVGIGESTFCIDRANCGEGGAGRIGDARVRPGAAAFDLALRTGAQALVTGSARMLALYGRLGDGMGLQSNHHSCPARPSGQGCDPQ